MTASTTVTRTYLRMSARAALRPGRDAPNARAERLTSCTTDRYRGLYRAVGDAWQWHDRDAWSDERLAEHLAQSTVGIYLFTVDGETAGYFELQRHDDGDVELVYFGLVPSFIGKGFGGTMLTAAVEEAWRLGATSVWLHTCTLDHPNALANYKARGFSPYKTEEYTATVKD
jgi:GNAT superfamily N-acetyltransferase